MDGRKGKSIAACEPEWREQRLLAGVSASEQMLHHVDPHITDQFDAFRDALLFQVVYRDLRGSQQQLTEVVSDDPVDFLGHGSVIAAQPSLDVCDGDLQFGSGKGTRQRRIRVAKHEDPIRLLLQHFGFERHEHGPVWAAWLPPPMPR